MTSSKSTKRALISGALAILMCTAMLIGTTFAWFTDTASTAVNKIQAGNLAIQLLAEDGVTSIEGKTLEWQKAAGTENETILWEPGCTYKLSPIIVKNAGSLALKYKIQIANIDGDAKLNEAIIWTVNDVSFDEEKALSAGEFDILTIEGHMMEDAGNEYQGLSIDGVVITVVATQLSEEKDSYDEKYDKDATYPIADIGGLKDAITKNGTYNVIEDITTDEQLLVKNAVVTIDATGKTINNTEDIWADGKAYALISASGSATDLTIAGGSFIAKENDCFTIDIWDGASVTIKNGTFSGNSSCVYVGEGTLTIEGGTFFIKQLSPNTNDYRYLLNCLDGNYKNGTAKIIVKGGTFVNFDPSDNAAEGEGTSFVADGYKVISEVHGSDTWYTVIAE